MITAARRAGVLHDIFFDAHGHQSLSFSSLFTPSYEGAKRYIFAISDNQLFATTLRRGVSSLPQSPGQYPDARDWLIGKGYLPSAPDD